MAPIKIPESAFQKQIDQLAATHGWKSYHTYSSQRSNPGFPDSVFVRERVVFAELKSDTGPIRSEQVAWLWLLRRADCEVYLWRPKDFERASDILQINATGQTIPPEIFALFDRQLPAAFKRQYKARALHSLEAGVGLTG